MKGVAMKAGQMLSVVDLEAVPPAYRDEVRATLAELRDSAPSVSFARHAARARARVRRARWTACSRRSTRSRRRRLDRAGLPRDARRRPRGRRQGPVPGHRRGGARGPAEPRADAADRQADRARTSTSRTSPTRSASASTRSSTTSSRRQNTRAVARAHRGHPFIVIPEVVTDLCRAARDRHGLHRRRLARARSRCATRRRATASPR